MKKIVLSLVLVLSSCTMISATKKPNVLSKENVLNIISDSNPEHKEEISKLLKKALQKINQSCCPGDIPLVNIENAQQAFLSEVIKKTSLFDKTASELKKIIKEITDKEVNKNTMTVKTKLFIGVSLIAAFFIFGSKETNKK